MIATSIGSRIVAVFAYYEIDEHDATTGRHTRSTTCRTAVATG
ncbi:MAG TPA: hypothetical protein VGO03_03090 [Acidimicrobiia bacterium]